MNAKTLVELEAERDRLLKAVQNALVLLRGCGFTDKTSVVIDLKAAIAAVEAHKKEGR